MVVVLVVVVVVLVLMVFCVETLVVWTTEGGLGTSPSEVFGEVWLVADWAFTASTGGNLSTSGSSISDSTPVVFDGKIWKK